MGLEVATYFDDLVTTNPVGATDLKSAGDDHLRLIKSTIKSTFPGLAGAAWRIQAKAAGYTVVANDNMTMFNCTVALTLALTAAATLGNKHMFVAYANGVDVTIDPNGAETINGAATILVPSGWTATVFCNGTLFLAFLSPNAAGTTSALTLIAMRDALGLGTANTPQFTGIEIGNASDTTLARASAGVASIEGKSIALLSLGQTWSALQTFSSGIAFANETLSSYDEGTWTPTLVASGAQVPTYSAVAGQFIRVGNRVRFALYISVNSASSATGSLTITGFAFTSGAGNGSHGTFVGLPVAWAAGLTSAQVWRGGNSSATFTAYERAATGGYVTTNTAAHLANSCELWLSGEIFLV